MVTGERSAPETETGMVVRKRNIPGDHSLPTPVLAPGTLARAVPREPGQRARAPAPSAVTVGLQEAALRFQRCLS